MKKTVLAMTMAASVLALSACSDDKASDSEIIAKTNAGNITEADLYEEMRDAMGAQVLENMILQRALENEYKVDDKEWKEEVENQKEMYGENFPFYLAQRGMTEKYFEKDVRSQMLQQKMVASLDIPEEKIEEGVKRASTELHARHMILPDEEKANEMIQKLKDGENFETLAIDNSTEPVAKDTGGDLGWFSVGTMLEEFEDAAYALDKGEISEPVKTKYGYHVIELLDKRKVESEQSDEEIRAEVEDNLTRQAFEEKLRELVAKADVKIEDKEFEDVMDYYLLAKDAEADSKE